MKEIYRNYMDKDHDFDKMTMIGIFSLIIVIAGVFGFLYEVVFYYFNGGMTQVFWRGSNFLPWINIYATGSLMVYFLTYKQRHNKWKVFLISFFACGILEYFSGLGMYILGDGLRCWDYNQEILSFGNIGGFVCLRSALFFGLSSLLLMYVIVPICFHLAKTMNRKLFLGISITLCSIILIDEFYNLFIARIFSLPRASYIYKKIGIPFVIFK